MENELFYHCVWYFLQIKELSKLGIKLSNTTKINESLLRANIELISLTTSNKKIVSFNKDIHSIAEKILSLWLRYRKMMRILNYIDKTILDYSDIFSLFRTVKIQVLGENTADVIEYLWRDHTPQFKKDLIELRKNMKK